MSGEAFGAAARLHAAVTARQPGDPGDPWQALAGVELVSTDHPWAQLLGPVTPFDRHVYDETCRRIGAERLARRPNRRRVVIRRR